MDGSGANGKPLAKNVRRLVHLDVPGAGQVFVAGDYAYIGHLPNKLGLGTSVVDVSDPRKPKVVASIDATSLASCWTVGRVEAAKKSTNETSPSSVAHMVSGPMRPCAIRAAP